MKKNKNYVISEGTRKKKASYRLDIAFRTLSDLELCINHAKTELITFLPSRYSRRAYRSMSPIHLNGLLIKEVVQVKYLGYIFEQSGKSTAHVDYCLAKAFTASCELTRILHKLNATDFRVIQLLYSSLVQSQFYGLAIMDAVQAAKALDKSNAFFFRTFVGLPRSVATCFAPAVGLFEWPHLLILRARIRFVERVCNYVNECAVLDGMRFMRWGVLPIQTPFFAYLTSFFVEVSTEPWYKLNYTALFSSHLDVIKRREEDSNLQLVLNKPTLHLTVVLFSGQIPYDFWAALGLFKPAAIRPVISMLAGTARWSCFGRERRSCPFCFQSFYGTHFLTCPQLNAVLCSQNCSLGCLLQLVREGQWVKVVMSLLRVYFLWYDLVGTEALSSALLELRLDGGF